MAINRDASTFKGARILSDGATLTRAVQESEMEHISATQSESYTWHSSYAATGGQEVLTIANDENDKVLVIEKIFLASTVTAATVFDVGDMASGTPAGTIVTPVNFNRGTVRDGTSRSSAFGNASVTGSVTISTRWLIPVALQVAPFVIDTEGAWLLGKGDAMVISASVSCTVAVTVEGYFVDVDEL